MANRDKTHCKRGHEFTVENTLVCSGRRHCRQCRRDLEARPDARARKRARERARMRRKRQDPAYRERQRAYDRARRPAKYCSATKKDGSPCRTGAVAGTDFCVHHSGRQTFGHPAALAARTHCPKGHPYDEANTATRRGGARICRRCRYEDGSAFRTQKREEVRDYMRAYYAEHKQAFIARSAHRRALIAKAPVIEAVARQQIYDRDGGRCHLCGKKVPKDTFHLDHLVPLSKGGAHASENLAVAHPFCNLSRGAGRLPAQLRLVG